MEIKELIEVAKTVKEFCKKQGMCFNCPFSYDRHRTIVKCSFFTEPFEWYLEEENNDES